MTTVLGDTGEALKKGLMRVAALIIAMRRAATRENLKSWWAAERERQRGRGFLWFPVAFGLGATLYIALKREPPVWWGGSAAAVAAAVYLLTRRFRGIRLWTGFALVGALGFLLAKVHSDAMATPIAPPGLGEVRLIGWVVDIASPSEKGARLVIAPVRIEGLRAAATPGRIRIVYDVPGGPAAVPPPGSAIAVATLLDPPPPPASPGVYDFARDAWFEGIGGVGIAMAPARLLSLPPPADQRLRLEMAVNALRWRVASELAAHITQVMGPNDGGAAGLAAAVTTSHQDWLANDRREDLRGSGLAHMLAIAGLHTAAVSGAAFFGFRFLIAAWPWLALRINGKKAAALGALIVVGVYLLLSGAHAPARRAAITASVAFIAILADRRAVSLHSLAIAALIIEVMEPEVVVSPGFEMSFCATAALVALAEAWTRPHTPRSVQGLVGWVQRGRDLVFGLAMVSFVAGAATGPFTIQHFNRFSNYSVFANLTADFVASVVMMPALAIALVIQALGLPDALGAPVYALAGYAAQAVIWLGHLFTTAPGSGVTMASAPTIALVVSYLGIVFACLWRGRLRWLGVALAPAVAFWPRDPAPVAWIAADGNDAAIIVDHEVVGLKPAARAYATGIWAQHRGFDQPLDPGGVAGEHFDCNRQECRPVGAARPRLAAWWTRRVPSEEKLGDLCAGADFLILRAEASPGPECRGVQVLTREDFARGGSAEIFATPAGWRIAWAQTERGRRPWTTAPSF